MQRKDFLPVLSLCQNLISHSDSRDFTFLTPAWTSTLVATTTICIELLDCRPDPDPLAAEGVSGPLGTYSRERVLVSWGGSEPSVAA